MPRGAASLQARLLVSRPACRIRSPAAAIHSGSCAVHPSRILRCSSIPGNTSKGRPPLPCGLPFDERRNNMVCKGVHVCLPVPSSDSTIITHLKVQWSPNFSKMEKFTSCLHRQRCQDAPDAVHAAPCRVLPRPPYVCRGSISNAPQRPTGACLFFFASPPRASFFPLMRI